MAIPALPAICAPRALYIKLGEGGGWEAECIRSGTLRFGYHDVPHQACLDGDGNEIARALRTYSTDPGAITRHINQVTEFYEAPEDVLWITFFSDRLWWCFSRPEITLHDNREKTRPVIGEWRDTDIAGVPLVKGRLSGKLLATQLFRGTICSVTELQYLLHKINATVEPHVAAAQVAYENLQACLIPIIRALHPNDLEILTDLIFRQSGWQRVGVAGGVEKDIDLDLISPLTGERVAVQVKSSATLATWRDYRERFTDMRGFSRFYFVTHSPKLAVQQAASANEDPNFVLWGAEQLAAQAIRGGLTGWLLDKAS